MPLEAAGLQEGDVITSIDGTRIPDGKAYENYIESIPFLTKRLRLLMNVTDWNIQRLLKGIQNPNPRIFLQYGIY